MRCMIVLHKTVTVHPCQILINASKKNRTTWSSIIALRLISPIKKKHQTAINCDQTNSSTIDWFDANKININLNM